MRTRVSSFWIQNDTTIRQDCIPFQLNSTYSEIHFWEDALTAWEMRLWTSNRKYNEFESLRWGHEEAWIRRWSDHHGGVIARHPPRRRPATSATNESPQSHLATSATNGSPQSHLATSPWPWPVSPNCKNFYFIPKYSIALMTLLKQENGRIVRLCPSLWKTTTVFIYVAHASPWLFIIFITKALLDFIHLLLKCRSRTEATHLSLKKIKYFFCNCQNNYN